MTTELPSSPLEGEKLFVEDPPAGETAEPGSESIGVSERISIIITNVDGNVIETREP